jgi:hypothetical protein
VGELVTATWVKVDDGSAVAVLGGDVGDDVGGIRDGVRV